MCRLCNAWISQGSTWLVWQRANCNGRIVTSSPQRQLMWLGGWNLLTHVTHSYDLPRSNMAQQHPGGGGYKVEPGVPPNAGDHESVSWHTFPSLLCSVIISIGSLRNERLSHGCMVSIESDSEPRGLPSLPEQPVPILTLGCVALPSGCNNLRAAILF
jgi:hypothetical protein